MILNRRLFRDFLDNLVRNLAMILIVALSIALVTALCTNTECLNYVIHDEWEKCNVEDGSFETYVPLSKRNMLDLADLDVTIEKMFYTDVPVNEVSVLRFFVNRKKIDLAFVEWGRTPQSDNELFMEKLYAKNHGLSVGDTFYVGSYPFVICGIGCIPDYGYVKQNTSDVAQNDEFSVALVTSGAFNAVKGTNKVVYNYAYKLGENCTAKDLKKKLVKLDFDPNSVKDTYIRGLIAEADTLNKEFNAFTDAVRYGSESLARGIHAVGRAYAAYDGERATKELYSGAMSLSNAAILFKEQFGAYLAESTKVEFVNLSGFAEARYSIRINDPLNDSKLGKQAGLVVGVILLMLLTYMLAIFAGGTIEKERAIIGTLYALGYSKKEILSHYMKIPLAITLIGSFIGLFGGFALVDFLAASYAAMYSFPELVRVYPLYVEAYAVGMPLALAYCINRHVLKKKLDETPLQMMHEKVTGIGRMNFELHGMSFSAKYRIRQFCREIKGNLTLFAGVILSVLLMMFSFACYGSITSYISSIADDVHYEYLYVLRNPVEDLPKNAVVGYTTGFNVDYAMTGGEMEVTLSGIDRDNPYFDFAADLSDEPGEVYMSSSARIKFGYKVGQTVVFHDSAADKRYAFKIAGEVTYGSGLYFFMNLDAMREAFGLDYFDKDDLKKGEQAPKASDYYYNTVYSDTPITFRHNMMVSQIVKSDLQRGADKFMTLMGDMIYMLVGVSVIIFVAVMYLLMKLEIDRSRFSISLLKALGYREKTVNSFYLSGCFYVTAASLVFGMPLCKLAVNALYPFCVSNVNGGFPAIVLPVHYVSIVLIVLACFFATRALLARYLGKIRLSDILKDRE